MIGKAYVSTFQYYNNRTRKMGFKNRPVLIVGQADQSDYVVLPISRVTNKNNFDSDYDIQISPDTVPLMNLTEVSYIRANKQTVIHACELIHEIVDFRENYREIYCKAIIKMKEFQKSIIKNAM